MEGGDVFVGRFKRSFVGPAKARVVKQLPHAHARDGEKTVGDGV